MSGVISLKRLHLEPGDLILVQYDPDNMEGLRLMLDDLLKPRSSPTGIHYVVRVPHGVSVTALPEKELERAGWRKVS